MSASDNHDNTITAAAAPTLGQKLARMIDDPVGSVVVGTAFPAAAIMLIAGGMYGIALIH